MERNIQTCISTLDAAIQRANECSDCATPAACRKAPNGSRYWLANLVFVAQTRHGAILLDLSSNRFLGVAQAETLVLQRVIEDWPARSSDFSMRSRPIAEKMLIHSLSSRGLIRFGQREPREIPHTSVRLDGELIAIGDEIDTDVRVSIGHVVLFFYSFIASFLALRFRAMAAVIRGIHARRSAAIHNVDEFDWRSASNLVSIFRRIRPYAFVASGHCLLHALTLVRFLAHYDVFPELVLGVKVDPWGAHSWVQHGNLLLDTNPEKVCGFTVILAV
jgi:hypothetical protein